MERIVSKLTKPSGALYEIKWKGFDSSQNTWEPIEHLSNAKQMLKKFEENLSKKKKKVKKTKSILKRCRKITRHSSTVNNDQKKVIFSSSSEEKDIPEELVKCITPKEKIPSRRLFKLSWRKRKDKNLPKYSIFSGEEIKKKFGNDILLNFYEENFHKQ